jgi:hypothetical protein
MHKLYLYGQGIANVNENVFLMGETMKRQRVLHICKYYYPFVGGTEQIERDIVLALKNAGGYSEQAVFCFDHAELGKSRDTEDVIDDIPVYRCKCWGKFASQSLSCSYDSRLKSVFETFKPDIVFFHYPNPFAAHYMFKYLKPDMKLVVYWHLVPFLHWPCQYHAYDCLYSILRHSFTGWSAIARREND